MRKARAPGRRLLLLPKCEDNDDARQAASHSHLTGNVRKQCQLTIVFLRSLVHSVISTRLDPSKPRVAKHAAMESPSSISQTAEGYMRFHLDRYYEHLSQRQENNIPSLASIAADAQVQDLENQEDIEAATVRLAEQWDLQELRLVMENPKATYRLLRAFHELRIGGGRRAIDLDEAIRRNESYLRDRSNVDGKYLISLEEFVSMLSDVSTSKAEVVSFIRKDAPKGGRCSDLAPKIHRLQAI